MGVARVRHDLATKLLLLLLLVKGRYGKQDKKKRIAYLYTQFKP